MPGMSALGLPDLLLARPGVERVVAKLALEHSQLLIRGATESLERGFLGAGVARFGVGFAEGAPSLLGVALVGGYLAALIAHATTPEVTQVARVSSPERTLVDLRERLDDRFEGGRPGICLGWLGGRRAQRIVGRAEVI
jgi:hypothetical protein